MADQISACDFWSFWLGNSWFDQPSTEGKSNTKFSNVLFFTITMFLAVLETVKSLIYQLLPPVFALISWHLEETHREEDYCVHCCIYFAAQCARS